MKTLVGIFLFQLLLFGGCGLPYDMTQEDIDSLKIEVQYLSDQLKWCRIREDEAMRDQVNCWIEYSYNCY